MGTTNKSDSICAICGTGNNVDGELCMQCREECKRISKILNYLQDHPIIEDTKEDKKGYYFEEPAIQRAEYVPPDPSDVTSQAVEIPFTEPSTPVQHGANIKQESGTQSSYSGGTTLLGNLPTEQVCIERAWLIISGIPGRKYVDRTPYVIGRSADKCNCVIKNSIYVGRTHARIDRNDGKYMITDLYSSNGTIVNSHRLIPNTEKYILNNGDSITMGDVKLTFFIENK